MTGALSMFDEMYSGAVAAQLAELHGVSLTYYPPVNKKDGFGQDREPIEIQHAIVGGVRIIRVRANAGLTKLRVQSISVCVDPNNPQYCGTETFSLNGWIVLNGRRYAILDIEGDLVWKDLGIEQTGVVERTDPNYRTELPTK